MGTEDSGLAPGAKDAAAGGTFILESCVFFSVALLAPRLPCPIATALLFLEMPKNLESQSLSCLKGPKKSKQRGCEELVVTARFRFTLGERKRDRERRQRWTKTNKTILQLSTAPHLLWTASELFFTTNEN